MKKYLLKRLLRLIPVFLGVTILAFLLTGLSSVDAVDLKESSSGGVMSEAEKEAMREELGLNEPKAVQYLQWLKNALRGDFGESYGFRQTGACKLLRKTARNDCTCGAGACHDGLSFVSARYLKCKISEYMGGPQYQPVLLCR